MRDDSIEPDQRVTRDRFAVIAGESYELRVALVATGAQRATARTARLVVDFRDAAGRPLDLALAAPGDPLPGIDPLEVEVLPPLPPAQADAPRAADIWKAAATASRYLVAPPDAVSVTVRVTTPDVAIHDLVMRPLALNWLRDADLLRQHVATETELRLSLIRKLFRETDESAAKRVDEMRAIPEAQIDAIGADFAPGGDWSAVLDRLDLAPEIADFETRIARLAGDRSVTPRVGFIGTARTYDRLRCLAEVFWLRETEVEAQITALAPDLVLIETAAESGSSDWNHAFHGLDGALPDTGAALIETARAAGIAVHVLASCAPVAGAGWRGAFAAADRTIVEDDPAQWTAARAALPETTHFIPRATEPAVGPAGVLRTRTQDLTLVPCGSDLFQFPDFLDLVTARHCHDTLIADFHHGFAAPALRRYIAPRSYPLVANPTEKQRRFFMQNATIVLLPGRSTRSAQEMQDLALDAIAAGAIPVIAGATELAGPLFDRLDRVTSARALQRLQRDLRIPWLHERRWRALYRHVTRHHRWDGAARAALLGQDPCAPDFDTPEISVVMVSKRLHLLERSLAQFRAQSWPAAELIVVLHMDSLPGDLPGLRANERIFTAPAHFNLGQCLNLGIAAAGGRYWAKMDDDDFYSATYLEELARYFHDTQADAVGGQAVYFYFAGEDVTRDRTQFMRHCRTRLRQGHYLCGATLSARREAATPPFSNAMRNGSDADWVRRQQAAGRRVFCYGATPVVVFRDADEGNHTWRLSLMGRGLDGLGLRQRGNIHDRFEHER